MKNLFLITTSILTLNLMALDTQTETICINGANCVTKTIYTNMPAKDLTMSQIIPGVCLVDSATNVVSRVLESDQRTLKIVTLTESSPYQLDRKIQFFNDSSFNRQLRAIPCAQAAPNSVLGKEDAFAKCVQHSGRTSYQMFCEKPVMTNF